MMKAMTKAKTSMSGERIAVRMTIMYANWTLVTSVVMRVTSEEVRKWSMFSKEKPCTAQKMSCRRFLPRPQEAVEQVRPASEPKSSESARHEYEQSAVAQYLVHTAAGLYLVDQTGRDERYDALHDHLQGDEDRRDHRGPAVLAEAVGQ